MIIIVAIVIININALSQGADNRTADRSPLRGAK